MARSRFRAARNSLNDLYSEREIIDKALELASAKQTEEIVGKVAEEIRERDAEWRELVWQTATTAAKLQKLAAQREAFLASLVSPAGRPQMATSQIDFGGLFNAGKPLRLIVEQALKAGIVTPKEVQ